MHNGDILAIRDLQAGDQLLGDDGTPRTVTRITAFEDTLEQVDVFGTNEPLRVTREQVLCFKATGNRSIYWNEGRHAFQIEYLDSSNQRRRNHLLYWKALMKDIIFQTRKPSQLLRSLLTVLKIDLLSPKKNTRTPAATGNLSPQLPVVTLFTPLVNRVQNAIYMMQMSLTYPETSEDVTIFWYLFLLHTPNA